MSTRTTTIEMAGRTITASVDEVVTGIGREVKSRAYRVANELENQSNMVLRGQRHGRRYIVPGTGSMKYKRGKRVVIGQEAGNYGRKGKKIYGREAGTAKITYQYYTASAPGESPANRLGTFRVGWHRAVQVEDLNGKEFNVKGVIENRQRVGKKGDLLGEILEEGTERMAPRPYKQRVIDRALPKAIRIYDEPYGRSYGP